MRDLEEDDSYDYSPNELARLHSENPSEYRRIVGMNVGNIEQWENNNQQRMQGYLHEQRQARENRESRNRGLYDDY